MEDIFEQFMELVDAARDLLSIRNNSGYENGYIRHDVGPLCAGASAVSWYTCQSEEQASTNDMESPKWDTVYHNMHSDLRIGESVIQKAFSKQEANRYGGDEIVGSHHRVHYTVYPAGYTKQDIDGNNYLMDFATYLEVGGGFEGHGTLFIDYDVFPRNNNFNKGKLKVSGFGTGGDKSDIFGGRFWRDGDTDEFVCISFTERLDNTAECLEDFGFIIREGFVSRSKNVRISVDTSHLKEEGHTYYLNVGKTPSAGATLPLPGGDSWGVLHEAAVVRGPSLPYVFVLTAKKIDGDYTDTYLTVRQDDWLTHNVKNYPNPIYFWIRQNVNDENDVYVSVVNAYNNWTVKEYLRSIPFGSVQFFDWNGIRFAVKNEGISHEENAIKFSIVMSNSA